MHYIHIRAQFICIILYTIVIGNALHTYTSTIRVAGDLNVFALGNPNRQLFDRRSKNHVGEIVIE